VLGFFALMEWSGHGGSQVVHPLGYIRSGQWALDRELVSRAWQPFPHLGPLPRLVWIPLALTAAAWLSVALWRGLEGILHRRGGPAGSPATRERAVSRARLLASFVAINLFFWFVDPLQGALGAGGGQALRSLVLLLTSLGLFRAWGRESSTYRRESTSDSLRRQLRDLPGLEPALDGRDLDALSPSEVFTLAKALPAVGRLEARRVYGEVMADMLRGGRLDEAQSLLELLELRQCLRLDDDDHHAVVDLLGKDHPELLSKTRLQRQTDDLRQEAARVQLQDFLHRQGLTVLDRQRLSPRQLEDLDRLRLATGLEQAAWETALESLGPRGEIERQRLLPLRHTWLEETGLLAWLDTQVELDPPLRPLRRVLARRLNDLQERLSPRLADAGLDPLPAAMAPAGDLGRVFDLLWRDPDPDTAAWVLMLERRRQPDAAARRSRDPRLDQATSPFLQSQLRGEPVSLEPVLDALTDWPMFDDVSPGGLLWLAERGSLRRVPSGELVIERGAVSDHLALVLEGEVTVQLVNREPVALGPGKAIGEIGVLTHQPRTATVTAGPRGCHLFVLPAAALEELLRRSDTFSRALLAQLAQRLAATTQAVPGSLLSAAPPTPPATCSEESAPRSPA